MAMPIIPRIKRGRLYFQTADVLLPSFAPAAGAGGAANAHQLDAVESGQLELHAKPSRRRCDDCQLHLTPDVLHALGTCPRWGKPRHGVDHRRELRGSEVAHLPPPAQKRGRTTSTGEAGASSSNSERGRIRTLRLALELGV